MAHPGRAGLSAGADAVSVDTIQNAPDHLLCDILGRLCQGRLSKIQAKPDDVMM